MAASPLVGKNVLITGAGRGIGRAYARAVAEAGGDVGVVDIDGDLAVSAAEEVRDLGSRAEHYVLDVTDQAAVTEMAAKAEATFGSINGLVANAALYAGLELRGPDDIPVDEWDRVMAVNVKGVFLCARAVVPAMRRAGGGSIVTQSSTGAWGSAALTHYTTSKAALLGLTRSLAKSYGPDGITVNAIAPGQIGTEATYGLIPRERLELMSSNQAIARIGEPGDLVGAVVYLLSDAARFMSGQVLVIDGGLVMR